MRLALVFTAVLLAITIPHSFGADDTLLTRYPAVAVKISEAEGLERNNDFPGARRDYLDSYDMLMKIRESDPTWEPKVVSQQIDDCLDQIRVLDKKTAKVDPSSPAVIQRVAGQSSFPAPVKTSCYPWKSNILTTIFWIGEDASHASAWNENWTNSNHGADDPNNRNGFAAAGHASTVNPFYVALPFNDLAHLDKAKAWVPHSWARSPVAGKQISACMDRWVCIKSTAGRICYAQWEDVGPVGNDHAEYLFGSERPAAGKAGLDVSPGVAQYLGYDGKGNFVTSWRFVDDADVPPGQWMKYDEQAVIFSALHELQKTEH